MSMSNQNYRDSDPPTSKAAALSIAPVQLSMMQQLIGAYLVDWEHERYGLTDDQAANISGLNYVTGYWKRCSDLRREKLIKPMFDRDGVLITRYSRRSGRKVQVCQITGKGKAMAEALRDAKR